MRNADDDAMRELLERTRTVAVLGLKDGEDEDSWRVARYLQQHAYRIVPVNPKLARCLDEPAFASLSAIDLPIDLIDLFRAPAHVPAHVDEILALPRRPAGVWMQLGVRHDESAERLARAGIVVVQDRCLMVEHRRLGLGAS
jgi:predicted CoA-binding protein